ncbi:MAG: GAF domain-containing protein [Elusimicrobiota bacterium]
MSAPLQSGSLPALYDVLDFLSRLNEADEDKVWARIVEKLCAALDVEAATHFTYVPSLRQLIARYSLGTAAQEVTGKPIAVGVGICGWVAKHNEPLVVADASADPRFLKEIDDLTGFKTKTLLAVPLLDRLDLSGVIELLNKRSGPFTAEDLSFVEAVCRATNMTLRCFRLESRVDKVTSNNASILENLGGGFIAIDMHGRMILCNPSAKRILGLNPELPMNLPAEQALIGIHEMCDILMDTLASRKTVKRQDLWWKRNDQTRILGYSTLLIQDTQGRISGAGITFQDITNAQK